MNQFGEEPGNGGLTEDRTPDLFSGSTSGVSEAHTTKGSRAAPGAASQAGLTRQLESAPSGFGRGPIPVDKRKFKYDVLRAEATKVSFTVSRDDRMSAEDAGAMLHQIHVMFGIAREEEHIIKAFDDAMFFYHTLNSASVLQPGRGKVFIDGHPFDMAEVITKLGEDARRFFRAFADEVKDVNKRVLKDYDPYDIVKAEKHGWLTQVALEKGVHRYPYLAHDSAEACVNLTIAERIAVANSKRLVISNTINAVDRANANSRVNSAGGYDSTSNSTRDA